MYTELDLTDEEVQIIINAAKRRGFRTPAMYIRSLLDADAAYHDELMPFDNDENSLAQLAIRQGKQEATQPDNPFNEAFWKSLEDEADN